MNNYRKIADMLKKINPECAEEGCGQITYKITYKGAEMVALCPKHYKEAKENDNK